MSPENLDIFENSNALFMNTTILEELFDRELGKLKLEIEAYRSPGALWKTSGEISNSAGNLCLHLLGNLNLYICKEIGGIAYIRNREAEFSNKDIPANELVAGIDEVRVRVKSTLHEMMPDQQDKDYPLEVLGRKMTHEFFLLHLLAHLTYHLGQINYHRRLLDI